MLLAEWFAKLRRYVPLFALACFGILISVLTFVTLHSLEIEKTRSMFQRAAQQRFEDVESDLNVTAAEVTALGAHVGSKGRVTRKSFETYAATLITVHDTGIQGMAWIPKISRQERAAFEENMRSQGLTQFEIRDLGPDGKAVRAADRPLYFPSAYLYPYTGNEVAVGYDDHIRNTNRRDVLMRAALRGDLGASRRVRLVQETSGNYGVLLVRPVYSRAGALG